MDALEKDFTLCGNQLSYSQTVYSRTVKNKTKGTTITSTHGLSPRYYDEDRWYSGGGTKQHYSCSKKNPDYDYVEFSFKKGKAPIIKIERGVLYPDGELMVGNRIKVGRKELVPDVDGIGGIILDKEREITEKEAKKLIKEFKSHMDELSPKIRRILRKVKTVTVW